MILTQAEEADFTGAESSAASTFFTLQQALSGQLNTSGKITSVLRGCYSADQTVTVVAELLSSDFASATLYCKLVSQQAIDAWQSIDQVFNMVSNLLLAQQLCIANANLIHHYYRKK